MALRYKAIISYDGSNFAGYQKQIDQRTIQQELETALSKINKEEIKVYSSGRTDTKVHALNQVIHFDSIYEIESNNYRTALNSLLPKDIYVKSVDKVDSFFHARFDAKKKHYRYILNEGQYNPFKVNYIYQYGKKLDIERMLRGAKFFLGEHDFRNFTSTKDDETSSFVRIIETFTIKRENDHVIFDIIGTGFLRYMVRMMVGMLISIGEARSNLEEIAYRLDIDEDKPCSYKAPGEGLYLVEVFY